MKRRLAAWLLLSVLVPMMVMTAVHRHEESAAATVCTDCAHHVAHAGHFNVLGDDGCDCVLCQFTSVVFLGSVAIGIAILTAVVRKSDELPLFAPVDCAKRLPGLRAPPKSPLSSLSPRGERD